jgi:hypothetical protein
MAKKLSLLDLDKEKFIEKIVSMTLPRPMNYAMIIKINKGTIPIGDEQVPDLEMGQTDAAFNHLRLCVIKITRDKS